jgi:uncharacterized repeat protein (TIGR01451 family)
MKRQCLTAAAVFVVLALLCLTLSGDMPFRQPKGCACLYSGMDGMEMLEDANWDGNNPDAGNWLLINVIPQGDANASAWGVRFPDLPWSFMYASCADWIYGNNDWNQPVSGDHEYYRLPFTVPIDGNCVMVRFQAYIDDSAKFYIDGPGFSGPTLFYKHDPAVSMWNHDPVGFWIDPGVAVPICLGPGDYTIYIDHVDTAGGIYGLIFTAECVPCECPSQCQCAWSDVHVSWTDSNPNAIDEWTGSCGDVADVPGHITPLLGTPIDINTSVSCQPSPPCEPSYECEWEVTEVGPGPAFSANGVTLPVSFTPTATGWNTFEVVLNASCNGSQCPPCILLMRVNPQGGTPSISVDKMVSVDGGATWEEEVEQDVCQNVQFQITVTNDGAVPLANIVISDYLPDCLEYVDGPAVELCLTQEPPYWNLPGTSTPTWKCTSGLDPGNSVQVIYTVHVVESGGCKNQVSVEGEHNGAIVTDVDGAFVTGITGTCGEVSLPVCRCNLDDFSSPAPSNALLDWIDVNYAGQGGTRTCDEVGYNRYWAHTFTGLEPPAGCHIVSATLEIMVKNNHYNDHLRIGCITHWIDTWEVTKTLTDFGVGVGSIGTLILDLGTVNCPIGLATIGVNGFLDIAVDDDSTVDCAVLHIVYGP